MFEDPATGTRFEAPEGVNPERDKNVRRELCTLAGQGWKMLRRFLWAIARVWRGMFQGMGVGARRGQAEQ